MTFCKLLLETLALYLILLLHYPLSTSPQQATGVILVSQTLHTASSASSPTIDLMGVAWSKLNLKVLIVRSADSYAKAVASAFEIWEDSIEAFTNTYGYSYLKSIDFQVEISPTYSESDIVVLFTSAPTTPGGEAGVAKVTYEISSRKIVKVEITIHLKYLVGSRVLSFSPTDVYNIALHEIGHALGLDHASTAYVAEEGYEVMYPYYSPGRNKMYPSTLDLYALAVIYSWIKEGVFHAPSAMSVALPPAIPYEILMICRVKVLSPYGEVYGSGVYLRGTVIEIGLKNTTIYLTNETRAVFKKWTGSITAETPVIKIRVLGDLTIVAVWEIQHYIRIETPYSQVNVSSGWFTENTEIVVSLKETVVYYNNGTRRVFVGWTGSLNSSSPTVVVSVTKPLKLIALWKTQYWIEVNGLYSPVNITSGWYDRYSRLVVFLEKEVVDFSNHTRVVFDKWSTGSRSNPLEIVVTKPLTLVALWRKEYWIEVVDPLSIVQVKSGWFAENTTISLKLVRKVVDHNNNTRSIFLYWSIGGEIYESEEVLVTITDPIVVSYVTVKEYLCSISVVDLENETLKANLKLVRENLEVSVNISSGQAEIWLRRGIWSIVKALYVLALNNSSLLIEAEPLQRNLSVFKPLEVNIVLRVRRVRFRVLDTLGIPAPLSRVVLLDLQNLSLKTDYYGLTKYVKLPERAMKIKVEHLGASSLYEIIPGSSEIVLRTYVSIYTLLAIFLTLVFLIVLLKHRKKKRKQKTK